jgi:hypothetical protein
MIIFFCLGQCINGSVSRISPEKDPADLFAYQIMCKGNLQVKKVKQHIRIEPVFAFSISVSNQSVSCVYKFIAVEHGKSGRYDLSQNLKMTQKQQDVSLCASESTGTPLCGL